MSSKRLIAAKASCLEPYEPNFAKRHHEVSPPVQSVTSPQLCNSAQSPNVHAQLFLKQHVLSTFAATILELKLESQPHHLGQLCANDAHLVKPKLMVPAAAQSDLQRSVAVSPVECSAGQHAPMESRKSRPSKSPRLETSTTDTQTHSKTSPIIMGMRYLLKLVLQPKLPQSKFCCMHYPKRPPTFCQKKAQLAAWLWRSGQSSTPHAKTWHHKSSPRDQAASRGPQSQLHDQCSGLR